MFLSKCYLHYCSILASMSGMVIITTTVISAGVITVTLTEFENFSIA